jgi:hypothetical protein
MTSETDYTPRPLDRTPSFHVDDLLDTEAAARLTGHPATVLAQYRRRRSSGEYPNAGPEFVRFGRAVFYTRQALDEYNRKRGV